MREVPTSSKIAPTQFRSLLAKRRFVLIQRVVDGASARFDDTFGGLWEKNCVGTIGCPRDFS